MTINKIILGLGICFAVFIVFIFIQFNPFSKTLSALKQNNQTASTVTIDTHTFNVFLAKTQAQQEQGLSGKPSIPMTEGELFIFNQSAMYTFWMKEMRFPLDIIFIQGNKIVSIGQNEMPPKKLSANPTCNVDVMCVNPVQPADKVLEINAGLSNKYGFKPGDTVTFKLQ